MKKSSGTVLIILLCLFANVASAQRWKRMRYELSFGAGVSNFLGELGGANQIGTNYFRDLEFSQTRFAAAIGLRYKITPYLGLNTHLTYGRVSGDDKLTEEYFRNLRNLNFHSDIYEFNINFEAAFQQEQIGHRYRLRKVKGSNSYEIYTYGFVGVGVFYFDPKTETDQGETVRLQPLGTEGEGLIPTRKKYSLVQFCIPVGFGFKYTIDRIWGVGLEFGIRKTFTDYIDDVSTTYFDFQNYSGYDPLAPILGNRALEPTSPIVAPGNQRGDPRDHDSYMFAIFSINMKIKNGRRNLPLF